MKNLKFILSDRKKIKKHLFTDLSKTLDRLSEDHSAKLPNRREREKLSFVQFNLLPEKHFNWTNLGRSKRQIQMKYPKLE